jgi:hypothetical protein
LWFLITNAGDIFCKAIPHDHMEHVSGHLLLNQAPIFLKRYGKAPVSGTQAQKHFIQPLASSIPGESSPLLYMESSLFTGIFYMPSLQSTPNYYTMSHFEHDGFANSMEELFGLIVFQNWMKA